MFFEKKSHLVHKYKPHEARFCAAWFFSGTKNSVSRGLACCNVDGKKMARNGCKTAIRQSTYFWDTLYYRNRKKL